VRIIDAAKKLFFKEESKKIFGHKAHGESCYVCGKPMHTEHGVTMVGSGEKMHSDCWPDFFTKRVEKIAEENKQ